MHSFFDFEQPTIFDVVIMDNVITTNTHRFHEDMWICGDTSTLHREVRDRILAPKRHAYCTIETEYPSGRKSTATHIVSFPDAGDGVENLMSALNAALEHPSDHKVEQEVFAGKRHIWTLDASGNNHRLKEYVFVNESSLNDLSACLLS